MEIKIIRRHSADCPDKADRYAPRFGCPRYVEQYTVLRQLVENPSQLLLSGRHGTE